MHELILIVSSDAEMNDKLQRTLLNNNYRVKCASTGLKALDLSRAHSFELIVLDLDIRDIRGLDVCIILKSDIKTKDIPIMLLVNSEHENEIENGIEIGVFDYVLKPVNPNIFISKIHMFFGRRSERNINGSYSTHNIYLNSLTYEVRIKERLVDLTLTEFQILMLLMKHPGIIFRRNEIIGKLREIKKKKDSHIKERSIDVHINNLRKKLGSEGNHIQSIYGLGYRLN